MARMMVSGNVQVENMTQARRVRNIAVQYYAHLREERGLSVETLQTDAETPRQLYLFLREQHGFSLPIERLTVAINDAFADWDAALEESASVVFIPPVAGG